MIKVQRNVNNNRNVKRLNRILIRNIIRKLGPIARYELAERTGLTPPTVTVIVNELIKDGVVVEVGFGESSGGRRPVMLELNPKAAYVFAISLQRDEAMTALFDIGGNILSLHKWVLDTSCAEDVVEAIGSSFDWFIEESNIDRGRVLYSGVATPGLINTHRGLIKRSSNLGWDEVPFGAMLSKRLYGIPVQVENNSNAAAFAEKEHGSGQGYRNLFYLNLSVGVGAGIIIDGELYSGTTGYAGEIGHIHLDYSQLPTQPGQNHNLESVCGVRSVVERIKNVVSDGALAEHGLSRNRLNMADILVSSLPELPEVRVIFEKAAHCIGITVANTVSVFNPELIILGGELPKVGQFFTDAVLQAMLNGLLKEFFGTVKVVSSNMSEDPPLMGAYALALDTLFSIQNWEF